MHAESDNRYVKAVLEYNGGEFRTVMGGVRTDIGDFRMPLLGRDGRGRWSLLMWRLGVFPGAKDYDEMSSEEIADASSTYIQSGGSAERLSVEIRRREGDGYRQYVVGHSGGQGGGLLTEQIPLGPNEPLAVRPSEVFDADEAAELFFSWYKTGDIPDSFTLRELEI